MRQRIARASAVLLMVCASAFTMTTPAAADNLNTDRFSVTLRSASEHFEDVGKKGPSIGDYIVFRDRLFHQGNKVGRDNGRCDVTRAGPERFALACTVTVFLNGRGQIALQGLVAFRRGSMGGDPTLAITGGTGWYNHASGTATLTERRDGPTRLLLDMR